MPFEVPESWEWIRLDSIGDIVTGSTPPKDNKELYGGHIPFYKPTDLEQGINTTTSTDSLKEEGFAVARQLPTDRDDSEGWYMQSANKCHCLISWYFS